MSNRDSPSIPSRQIQTEEEKMIRKANESRRKGVKNKLNPDCNVGIYFSLTRASILPRS